MFDQINRLDVGSIIGIQVGLIDGLLLGDKVNNVGLILGEYVGNFEGNTFNTNILHIYFPVHIN